MINSEECKIFLNKYFEAKKTNNFNIDVCDGLLSKDIVENAKCLYTILSSILKNFSLNLNDLTITSGYREVEYNKRIGGATLSKHTKGQAVDLMDRDGHLDELFLQNIDILKKTQCAIEHPLYTKGWCHFQIVLPRSGKNIFIPYNGSIKENEKDLKFTNLKL